MVVSPRHSVGHRPGYCYTTALHKIHPLHWFLSQKQQPPAQQHRLTLHWHSLQYNIPSCSNHWWRWASWRPTRCTQYSCQYKPFPFCKIFLLASTHIKQSSAIKILLPLSSSMTPARVTGNFWDSMYLSQVEQMLKTIIVTVLVHVCSLSSDYVMVDDWYILHLFKCTDMQPIVKNGTLIQYNSDDSVSWSTLQLLFIPFQQMIYSMHWSK